MELIVETGDHLQGLDHRLKKLEKFVKSFYEKNSVKSFISDQTKYTVRKNDKITLT